MDHKRGDEGEKGREKGGEKGAENGKRSGGKGSVGVDSGKGHDKGVKKDGGLPHDNVVMMLVERGVRHPASLSSSLSLLLEVPSLSEAILPTPI